MSGIYSTLNTGNSLHSRLKAMLNQFHGVSTKYLNGYLSMFVALEQAGRSKYCPAIDAVRAKLARVSAFHLIRSLRKEGLLAI